MKLNHLVVTLEELEHIKKAYQILSAPIPSFVVALQREMEYQNAIALYYKLEAMDCKE